MLSTKSVGNKTSNDCWVGGNFKMVTETDEIPFRRSLYLLGIFGALPFTWRKPYYPSLHPLKSTFILAVTVYTGSYVSLFVIVKNYFGVLVNEEVELHIKIMVVEVFLLGCFTSVTLAVWTDVPSFQRLINTWIKLTDLLWAVTSKKFRMRWHTTEKNVILVLLILPWLMYEAARQLLPEMHGQYEYAVNVVHSGTVCFFIGVIWIGYFSCLEDVAKEVCNDLNMSIERNILTQDKLKGYKNIWREIRTLTDILSSLNAPFIVYFLSVVTVIFLLYSTLILTQMGRYLSAFPHLFIGLTILGVEVSMARKSHIALDQVKLIYTGVLAQQKLSSMSETSQCQVISMYFGQQMRKPLATFGGFIVTNKTFVFSFLGVVSLHVVILSQVLQPNQLLPRLTSYQNKTV